jgi:hypothetical protein
MPMFFHVLKKTGQNTGRDCLNKFKNLLKSYPNSLNLRKLYIYQKLPADISLYAERTSYQQGTRNIGQENKKAFNSFSHCCDWLPKLSLFAMVPTTVLKNDPKK